MWLEEIPNKFYFSNMLSKMANTSASKNTILKAKKPVEIPS